MEIRKPTRKLAAATAILCLSGCAAGAHNLRSLQESSHPSVREVMKRGVTEKRGNYVATGCSSFKNLITARNASALRARVAIARHIAGSNLVHGRLRGSEITDVFTTAEGHTCVVVGMPKTKN